MSDDILVEKKDHSKFGASGSYIWLNCHGAHNLKGQLKLVNKGGMAANEGTAAHEVGANCLTLDQEPFEYIDTKITVEGNEFVVDTDMIEAVTVYTNFVREKIRQFPNAIIMVEHPMASAFDEDAYGTGDLVIYVPGDRIIITDYKHGRGVVVEPTSPQLKEYGYLAYENRPAVMQGEGEPKVIELIVVQPRIPHPKGPIRKHVSNPNELTTWFFDEALHAMNENRKPDAPLNVGAWCQWCPVGRAAKCPAQLREVQEIRIDKEPVQMTGEELGRMLDKLEALKPIEKALQEEAYRRAMNGEKVHGRKLVHMKANRVFKDGAEDIAKLTFGDDAYHPPEFKSPPQIEKLSGGKEFVNRWAMTPVTGLTLAKSDDKRAEAKPLMQAFAEHEAASTATV